MQVGQKLAAVDVSKKVPASIATHAVAEAPAKLQVGSDFQFCKLPLDLQIKVGQAFLYNVQESVLLVTDVGQIIQLIDWRLGIPVHVVVKYFDLKGGLCEEACRSLAAFAAFSEVSLIIIDMSKNCCRTVLCADIFADEVARLNAFLASNCQLHLREDLYTDVEDESSAGQLLTLPGPLCLEPHQYYALACDAELFLDFGDFEDC